MNPFFLTAAASPSFDLSSLCEAQGGTCTDPYNCQLHDQQHNSEIDISFQCTSTTICCLGYKVLTVKKVIQPRQRPRSYARGRGHGFNRIQGHIRGHRLQNKPAVIATGQSHDMLHHNTLNLGNYGYRPSHHGNRYRFVGHIHSYYGGSGNMAPGMPLG